MPPEAGSPELELRDYFRVLRRRKKPVVLAILVTITSALLSSFLQTPVYQSTAEVVLQPPSAESLFDPTTGIRLDPERVVETEIKIIKSHPVRQAVSDKLGTAPPLSASSSGKTDVIALQVESTDPQRAATIVNAYANAYIDFRRTQAVNGLLKASEEIQEKVDQLQRQIDTTEGPQKGSLIAQQALFKQKLDQTQVDGALKTGGAQLVTPADPPAEPIRPKPVRSAALALAVGSFLGISMAFLFEYLDESIKTKEDFERAVPGLGVIGLVPAVPGWKARGGPQVVSLQHPKSATAEAYRTLRTSIQFQALDQPMRVLQVTSPNAQEGKTTTLANLGVALASAGQRVVIMCCDLRRPRLHEFFGLENSVGFTSVLLGQVGASEALQQVPGQPGLSVMASGPPLANPSEVLSSPRAVEVVTLVQARADVVLVDSPPVLPVTDSLVLAGRVDATFLVVMAGSTNRTEAARAVELLRQVDAPLIGAVLNGVQHDAAYGYAYQYYRTHEHEKPAPNGDAAVLAGRR